MKHSLLTTLFLALLFAYGFPSSLQANELINVKGIYYISNGNYYIDEDEKGVYLRTDKDLSWYLDEDDLGVFKLGESGFYYLETNASKPFILTDKKRIFYINQEVAENLKKGKIDSGKDYEPYEIIKGIDKFYTKGSGLYVTKEEARRGKKGQPTLEWERKKAEEEAQKRVEEEARIKAEEEEARKKAELKAIESTISRAIQEAEELKLRQQYRGSYIPVFPKVPKRYRPRHKVPKEYRPRHKVPKGYRPRRVVNP